MAFSESANNLEASAVCESVETFASATGAHKGKPMASRGAASHKSESTK